MWFRPRRCLTEKTMKSLVFTVFLRMENPMLCGRLFINTWPTELSINTGVTSVEHGAYVRTPVFPCKHKCCCYIAQRSNLGHLYNPIGPEGYEGIDCIPNQKISDTDTCGHGGHARACKGLDHKGSWSFIIPRARLQRHRPHKTR